MKNKQHDIVTDLLHEILLMHTAHPEPRLCQLIHNVAMYSGWKDNDLFYLSDEQLLEGFDKMKRDER